MRGLWIEVVEALVCKLFALGWLSVSFSSDKNLHQARWQKKKKGASFLVKPACFRVGLCQEKVTGKMSCSLLKLTSRG